MAGPDSPVPDAGPLPRWLGDALAPLYRAEVMRRNRRFDRGVNVARLDVPVISVGNLSVGGTGKTPMVMHLVSMLLRAGRRPCIAMRGYRKGGVGEADETDAYRREFPDVPMVAQPDRLSGLRKLLKADARGGQPHARPDCVVLDDGFQHRRIARDLDMVLIDATRSPFRDRVLPSGWLREPVEGLSRADVVVVTHAEQLDPAAVQDIENGVRAIRGGRGVDAVARHLWTGLLSSHTADVLPLDWLADKRVVASCAIGNPRAFLHSLERTLGEGGQLAQTLVLPDHDPYGREVVLALVRLAQEAGAQAIVVTDKDWSKLRRQPAETWAGLPVVRPRLALGFDSGAAELEQRVLSAAAGRR